MIKECARQVRAKFPEFRVFSIQFFGECWTGEEGEYTYDMYGSSKNCWKNVGKEDAFYAYKFV